MTSCRLPGSIFPVDTSTRRTPPGVCRRVDPVAVMQMQDRRRWHGGMCLCGLAVESRRYEHPEAQETRILDFQTYLGGSKSGVQDLTDIDDPAFQHQIRIRVQTDIRGLAQMDLRQIVLIDIADDPDVRHVGDREGGSAASRPARRRR